MKRLLTRCASLLLLAPVVSAAGTERALVTALENELLDTLLTRAVIEARLASPAARNEVLATGVSDIKRAVNTAHLDGSNQHRLALLAFLASRPATTNDTIDPVAALSARQADVMARIEAETGDTNALHFAHLRQSKRYYFDGNPAGRQRYLDLFVDELLHMEGTRPWCYSAADYGGFGLDGSAEQAVPVSYLDGNFSISLDAPDALPLFEIPALAAFYGVPGLHGLLALAPPTPFAPLLKTDPIRIAWAWYFMDYVTRVPELSSVIETPLPFLYFESLLLGLAIAEVSLTDGRWTEDDAVSHLLAHSPYNEKRIRRELDNLTAGASLARAFRMAEQLVTLREAYAPAIEDQLAFHDWLLGFGLVPGDFLAAEARRRFSDRDRAAALQAD